MFVKAIEDVGQFTRPIHTITRNYNETIVNRGAATLFFVNENGFAVTCKHVIDLISRRAAINAHYENFVREKATLIQDENYNNKLTALENKYNIKNDIIVQLLERFVDCTTEPTFNFRWINHPKYDLSILIFDNFKNPAYQSHATFLKDTSSLKPGKFLCRLGFPFPEFSNFKYNESSDSIEWTQAGQNTTPRFPIEGMLTRHLADANGIFGLELSTPGLKGQSGGPLFNEQGLICGMQSMTNHLHLGFDMKDFELKTGGKPIMITNQPFLHVGHCIHADIIKDFLKANNVKYYEA
ncbi:trypsin-like peptidase domain-containing protein [Flavobacterium capsici]|uniref:Trypsin-like peptidase domain-containing protein n=1 Tax=Flavobacterium capsici TaxID=3075618 RepID=A0AA96J501_9FLAO|nr:MULTISPECIES: trypsin-like peptidase domain-containing protein [unclassified Flavobacterium]WNM18586.1 trypsin-like peptidase domain-containing protein [Flavobacterium sp. PMR2A8]WNM22637.1 trypsin-like peptidase domain-containing protein [Flavobacterium sp. PMTSA4]